MIEQLLARVTVRIRQRCLVACLCTAAGTMCSAAPLDAAPGFMPGPTAVTALTAAARLEANVGSADSAVSAASAAPAASQRWPAVSDTVLAEMRGGFDTGTGLLLSFGIERAVYINGALVTTTALSVVGLGSAAQSAALVNTSGMGAVAGLANLVQNGQASILRSDAGGLSSVPATVIQNTLNDQAIRSVTTINVTSNSLDTMRSLNTGGALRDALGAAVTPH